MKPDSIGIMALTLFAGMYAVGGAEETVQNLYGEGNINAGQIMNGNSRIETKGFQHRWMQSTALVLGDSVTSGDRMSMRIELAGEVRYALMVHDQNTLGYYDSRVPNGLFMIRQASATYVFGDAKTRPLSITTGYFPYKYNPDVTNLGDYLFRSMTCPYYVNTLFDQPFSRLLGFKLSNRLLDGMIVNDLIFSNEWNQYPTKDFSLAYVGSVNVGSLLGVGIGAQAFHLFPVLKDYTSPGAVRTKDRLGSWYYASLQDSIANIKSYYTFKGTKLMARVNIHPLAEAAEMKLPVLGTLFGKHDLNVYGEADVLGLKNYPTFYAGDITNPSSDRKKFEFYNKINERVPVTFGINAPTNPLFAYGLYPTATFLMAKDKVMLNNMGSRLLWTAGSAVTTAGMLLLQDMFDLNVRPDVLSFEFEYWTSRYPNSWFQVYQYFIPMPEWDPGNAVFVHNRWRWSVYAKKTIGNFYAKLGIAHDHLQAFQPQLFQLETADNTGAAGYWWWTLKTGYSF